MADKQQVEELSNNILINCKVNLSETEAREIANFVLEQGYYKLTEDVILLSKSEIVALTRYQKKHFGGRMWKIVRVRKWRRR